MFKHLESRTLSDHQLVVLDNHAPRPTYLSTPENTRWSIGASERNSSIKLSSSRTLPTLPCKFGFPMSSTTDFTRCSDDETIVT